MNLSTFHKCNNLAWYSYYAILFLYYQVFIYSCLNCSLCEKKKKILNSIDFNPGCAILYQDSQQTGHRRLAQDHWFNTNCDIFDFLHRQSVACFTSRTLACKKKKWRDINVQIMFSQSLRNKLWHIKLLGPLTFPWALNHNNNNNNNNE